MNAPVTFPMDLTETPTLGYVEISRAVALLNNSYVPATQAARLTLRAAALQASAHASPVEIARSLRALAAELEAMG